MLFINFAKSQFAQTLSFEVVTSTFDAYHYLNFLTAGKDISVCIIFSNLNAVIKKKGVSDLSQISTISQYLVPKTISFQ